MTVNCLNGMNNRYRFYTRFLVVGYVILSWWLFIDWWIWKSVPMRAKDTLQPNSVEGAQFLSDQSFPKPDTLESELLEIAGYTNVMGFEPQQLTEQEGELQEADLEIAYRVQRVRDICQKYHMGKYRHPNSWNNDLGIQEKFRPRYETDYFFLLRKWGFSYCPVYKAGSTSMFHNLLLLGGLTREELKTPKQEVWFLATEMYKPESTDPTCKTAKSETIEGSVKLLVVRHPFERLLSLFLDKLSNSTIRHEDATLTFYNYYGKNIVKKYRSNSSSLTQIEPIWPEFVEYILKEDLANDHWRPVFSTCTPCLVNYDIIAKLETFSRDQAYFIRKLDLDTLKEPSWEHKVGDSTEEKRRKTAQTYFGQLTKKQIRELVKIYFMDFLLFDYSPEEYIAYGKDE